MASKVISEAVFTKRAEKHPGAAAIGREVEWFGVDSDSVVGAVFLDKIDTDYGWVILGPDPKGRWRCIEVDSSIGTQAEARSALCRKLEEIEKTGQRVWKQD